MTASPVVTQPRPQTIQPRSIDVNVKVKTQPSWQIWQVQPTPQPATRPARVLLGTLGDWGFRVLKPISIDVEFRDDSVVTSWQDIDEFGTGPSVYSSAEDLGRTVAELYRALESDERNLGPEMQKVWNALREYVVPRR